MMFMKNSKLNKKINSNMKKTINMKKFSKRGIFFSVIVLFSASLILTPLNGYAEEIDVKSVGLDKTTIITFSNDGSKDLKTFRIWLSQDTNFQSFKTEKGWIGEKNPQGVIIFTSSESIQKNESVKFGIKTDKPNPAINWKGLDQNNTLIDTGVILTTKIQKVNENPTIESKNIISNKGEIFTDSTFRIIPDKPNVGSTIRVTGDSFGALQTFDFYVDTNKIGSFETDDSGFFITTMQIPSDQKNKRVDFKIKNEQGQEKIFSVRLGEETNRITEDLNTKLTLTGIKNTMYQGEVLDISGQGIPNTSLTIKISNPNEVITNTRITQVDNTGKWTLNEPISIPLNAIFGKYNIIISDGENQLLKNWEIQTDKKILIESSKKIFGAGDLIKFNGTGIPNNSMELILENNLGDEMASEIFELDDSGFVNFEYQTTENEDIEGTWTLIVSQGNNVEYVHIGYDQVPDIPIIVKFDKENYKTSESATISLIGEPSDKVKIIIINPTGGIQGTDIPITLGENGKAKFSLDLSGYTSGIYSAVIQKGNSQNSEQFSVGLQIGSGPIEAKTTQLEYIQGDRLLILGNANPNSLMVTTLIDPSGKEVKKVSTPTNNDGVFSENRIKIPKEAQPGQWQVQISSGANMTPIDIDIKSPVDKKMTVSVTENIDQGEIIEIIVFASDQNTIRMQIMNANNEIIEDSLTCTITKEMKCQTFWIVPKEVIPGTYTVSATNSIHEDSATFVVNVN